jgi:hypothetical protein
MFALSSGVERFSISGEIIVFALMVGLGLDISGPVPVTWFLGNSSGLFLKNGASSAPK